MLASAMARLIALARRDLGADEVRLLTGDETPSAEDAASATTLECRIEGRDARVVAFFRSAPDDVEALQRRLDMLVGSFTSTFGDAPASARPSPGALLHAELITLVERAAAVFAAIIDADTCVVWGSASAASGDGEQGLLAIVDGADRAANDAPLSPIERAITEVRAMPALASLHRGGHVHASVRDDDYGYVARSLASLYVLVLAFDGPYDELGAERELAAALPTIERLVVALPPIDPGPLAGAMRGGGRPKRRR